MRKATITGLLAAAVLTVACGLPSSNDAGGSGNGTPDNKPAAKVAKIGEPVRDGKFEFIVKSVKCGVAKIGGAYVNKKAQGQFCLVTITVKNIGKEPQTFSDGNQEAFGTDKVRYSTDTSAGIYLDNNDTFLNEINPGNQVTGVLVFDIPTAAKLASMELHDSAFSGGVTVSLS